MWIGPFDSAAFEPDTLSLDSAGAGKLLADRADSLWLDWCAEAYCVSTDSAVWYAGTSSRSLSSALDTAAVVAALMDLDRRSPMDLQPNGAVLDRIVFMMRNRPRFLGKMMGQIGRAHV